MLVAERHQKIVEVVNERKSIRVSELSNIFSVTEETIRRDLEKLEKDNLLARSHGGAVCLIPKSESREIPFSKREITNVNEKKEIAVEAIKQVNEGDKIILDASSTAWYLAKDLPDIPLTVLTNSIKVAIELSSKTQIIVISTGGTLTSKSLSYVGPLAEESLNRYHVNKAFISCKGFDLEHGISESNEDQARVKKKMCKIADKIYVMIDHNKFGVRSFSHINHINNVDYVMTDSGVSRKIIDGLKEIPLEVITV